MNRARQILLLCLAGAACAPALACYTVYNPVNQVVYYGSTPPVDMRPQLHETVPYVFPGGHMVFGLDLNCSPTIDLRPAVYRGGGTQVTVITEYRTRGARPSRRDRE